MHPVAKLIGPEYTAAVKREIFVRDSAFIDCGGEVDCFTLTPLTLRKYIILRIAGSPFVCGGDPDIIHVAQFLWLHHPKYHPDAVFRRWLFLRFKAFLLYKEHDLLDKVKQGLKEFTDDALQDVFNGGAGGEKSYYSDAAGICYALRPWPEDYVLDMPMQRLAQYINIERETKGGLLSNNRSDTVIARWQRLQQESRNDTGRTSN